MMAAAALRLALSSVTMNWEDTTDAPYIAHAVAMPLSLVATRT